MGVLVFNQVRGIILSVLLLGFVSQVGASEAEIKPLGVKTPYSDMLICDQTGYFILAHEENNELAIWSLDDLKKVKSLTSSSPYHMIYRKNKVYVANRGKGLISIYSAPPEMKLLDEVEAGADHVFHLSAPGNKYFKNWLLASCITEGKGVCYFIDLTEDEQKLLVKEKRKTYYTVNNLGNCVVGQRYFPSNRRYSDWCVYSFNPTSKKLKLKFNLPDNDKHSFIPYIYQGTYTNCWFAGQFVFSGRIPVYKQSRRLGRAIFPDLTFPFAYEVDSTCENILVRQLDENATVIGKIKLIFPEHKFIFSKYNINFTCFKQNDNEHNFARHPHAVTYNNQLYIFFSTTSASELVYVKYNDSFKDKAKTVNVIQTAELAGDNLVDGIALPKYNDSIKQSDYFFVPSTDYKSMLFLLNDTVKVIDADGHTVIRTVKLAKPCIKIYDYGKEWVGFNQKHLYFFNPENGKITRSVDFTEYFLTDLACQPNKKLTYLCAKLDAGREDNPLKARRLFILTEKDNKLKVSEYSVTVDQLLCNPNTDFIFSAFYQVWKPGFKKFYSYTPAFHDISNMILNQSNMKLRWLTSNMKERPIFNCLRLAPDGGNLALIQENSDSVVSYDSANLLKPVQHYKCSFGYKDFRFHPRLNLCVLLRGSDEICWYERETGKRLDNKLKKGKSDKSRAVHAIYWSANGRNLLVDHTKSGNYINKNQKRRVLQAFPVAFTPEERRILNETPNCPVARIKDIKPIAHKDVLTFERLNKMAVRAIYNKDLAGLRYALNLGAEPNHVTKGKKSLLHLVIAKNDIDALKLLLHNKADSNKVTERVNTPLIVAVKNNNVDAVKLLLDSGADINFKIFLSPLEEAVKAKNVDMCKLLLKSGANFWETAFDLALSAGSTDIFDLLLANSRKINDDLKNKVLRSAVKHLQPYAVKKLLDSGFEVKNSKIFFNYTPLMLLAEVRIDDDDKKLQAQLKIANLLLKKGVEVNHQGQDRNTALLIATKNKNYPLLKELLKKGAKVAQKGVYGNTALHLAAKNMDYKAVSCLLENGADPFVKNIKHKYPYELAIMAIVNKHHQREDCLQVLKAFRNQEKFLKKAYKKDKYMLAAFLLANRNFKTFNRLFKKKRMNINYCFDDGNTLLTYFSSHNGNKDIVKHLVKRGADLNYKTCHGCYPTKSCSTKMKKLLIKLGADPIRNILHNPKSAPIIIAAAKGNYNEIARIINKSKRSINRTNRFGDTPLLIALKSNNPNSIRIAWLLIESGANVNVSCNDGITPLHLVARNQNIELIKLLLKYRARKRCKTKGEVSPLKLVMNNSIIMELLEPGPIKGASGAKWLSRKPGEKLVVSKPAPATNLDKRLIVAIRGKKKDPKKVKYLLNKRGINVNAIDPYLREPIIILALKEYQNPSIIKMLLKRGADPNLKSRESKTTIYYSRNHKISKMLMDYGFDIKQLDDDQLYMLLKYKLYREKNYDDAKILLRKSEKPNVLCSHYKHSLLHEASNVSDGKAEAVKTLKDCKADLEVKNPKGETPLISAIRRGKYKIASAMIACGANVNAKDNKKQSVLYHAINHKDMDLVNEILSKGANVDIKAKYLARKSNYKKFLPLLKKYQGELTAKDVEIIPIADAISRQRYDDALFMINNKKGDLNAKDKWGKTPLTAAVFANRPELVAALLKNGADPMIASKSKKNAIYYALMSKNAGPFKVMSENNVDFSSFATSRFPSPLYKVVNPEIAEILILKHGYKASATNKYNSTPLHWTNSLDVAKVLVKHGADVNVKAKNQRRPLHAAAMRGNLKIMEFFLKSGANPNFPGNDQKTPLHEAISASKDRLKAVKLLLKHKVDVNAKANKGRTPLHCAMSIYEDNTDMMLLLLKNGADPNQQCEWGYTSLHHLIKFAKKKPRMIKALIRNGAEINAASLKSGDTPLHIIFSRRCYNIDNMKTLLAKGADPNIKNKNGDTALHIAGRNPGNKVNITLLVKAKANINAKNNVGDTPLHAIASDKYGAEKAYELLKHGADINATNKNGHTPLDIAAIKHGNVKLLKLFLSQGAKATKSGLKQVKKSNVKDLIKGRSTIQ